MRIPLLNLYIMKKATFEAIVKRVSTNALKFRTEQLNILMKENDRLARGIRSRRKKIRVRRSKK